MSLAGRVDLGHAKRAEEVLQQIIDVQRGTDLPDEIRRRLKNLPAMLRVNGVPAALAFYAAKGAGSRPIDRAYRAVGDALCEELYTLLDVPDAQRSPARLFRTLADHAEHSPSTLAVAFARLEALAGWMRRLAQASGPDAADG